LTGQGHPRDVLVGPDLEGLDNREKIHRIVVLMLENRSFDHMLGYLSLPTDAGGRGRSDVDGLRLDESGQPPPEFRNTYRGIEYPIFPLGETEFGFDDGPDHSAYGIDLQLSGGTNQGYVENFAETRPDGYPPDRLGLVMGYYTGEDLYAHDFLARNFCVCDRWFCSISGATMPNRLYAFTGRGAHSRNGSIPPVYSIESIVRHLDAAGTDWRWFSHDPCASLWAIDLPYAANVHRALAHFQFFDEDAKVQTTKTFDVVRSQLAERGLDKLGDALRLVVQGREELERLRLRKEEIRPGDTFRSLAERGALPAVSFIDPLFVDIGETFPDVPQPVTNDDHAPSDVLHGQKLVADVVDALIGSDLWESTLLVVNYDEHGGFFDHVAPPRDVDDEDPDPQFHQLGPRVPALLVSPWVPKRSVSKTTYDHTSILKTILATFCLDPADHSIPTMGKRVRQARHVLAELSEPSPRPRSDLDGYDELAKSGENLGIASVRASAPREGHTSDRLTEWQQEYRLARTTVATMLGLADPRDLEEVEMKTGRPSRATT
jgi:phospholipase C